MQASDIPVEYSETVDSTNLQARRAIESGQIADSPLLVVAQTQTAGTGRMRRSWQSPVGGLWCTLAWPVHASVDKVLDGLGLRIGVAVVRAIEHTLDVHGLSKDVRLKWPNDVLIDGHKVAGILTETVSHGGTRFLLVGVGINANNASPDLPGSTIKAVSLREVIGHDVVMPKLQEQLVERVTEACSGMGLDQHTLVDARAYLFGIGTRIEATSGKDGTVRGTLTGLNDHGELVVTDNGDDHTMPRGADITWLDLKPISGV